MLNLETIGPVEYNLEKLDFEIDRALTELKEQTDILNKTFEASKSLKKLCLFVTEHGVSQGFLNLFEKDLKCIELEIPELADDLNNVNEVSDICVETFGEKFKSALIYIKDKIIQIFETIIAIWLRYLSLNSILVRKIKTLYSQKKPGILIQGNTAWRETTFRGMYKDDFNAVCDDLSEVRNAIETILSNTNMIYTTEDFPDLGMRITDEGKLESIAHARSNPPALDIPRNDKVSTIQSGWAKASNVNAAYTKALPLFNYSIVVYNKVVSKKSSLTSLVKNTTDEAELKSIKTQIVLLSDLSGLYIRVNKKLAAIMLKILTKFPSSNNE